MNNTVKLDEINAETCRKVSAEAPERKFDTDLKAMLNDIYFQARCGDNAYECMGYFIGYRMQEALKERGFTVKQIRLSKLRRWINRITGVSGWTGTIITWD